MILHKHVSATFHAQFEIDHDVTVENIMQALTDRITAAIKEEFPSSSSATIDCECGVKVYSCKWP